jgi:transposase InsO family protein
MDQEKANFTITTMARLLGLGRQRFHAWGRRRADGPGPRQTRMEDLVERVKASHQDSDGTYGAPRVTADLREDGIGVSRKTVAKAMKTAGIAGISPRTWHPPTTTPGPDGDPVPDLVGRRFDMGAKDAAWFSDITYLRTGEGWAYLCVVRDGHTRRVLGRVVAEHLRTDMVQDTLAQAVALRGVLPDKVIFHADRGCQYTSAQIADAATQFGLLRSMGKTGVCWDNAQTESFWSTFKAEYYERHVFATIAQARRAAYVWIDSWYNARRRHSKIGYIPPLQYEQRLMPRATGTT